MQGLPTITSIGNDGVAQYGDDRKIVSFYAGKLHNPAKSLDNGRPFFDPIDMIRVIIPGEKDVLEYIATEQYQRQYPRQWEDYKKGIEQRQSGTSLDLFLPDDPSTVANLSAMHINSVEQLASISDTAIGGIPRGRTLVESAKAYLQASEKGASFHALNKKYEDSQAALARLQSQVDAMLKKADEDSKKAKVA